MESEEFDVWDLMETTLSIEKKTKLEDQDQKESSELAINVTPTLNKGKLYLVSVNFMDITYHFFQTRIKGKVPVILTGMVTTWPAATKWQSVSYLASLFSDEEILVLEAKNNKHFFKNELTVHHHIAGNKIVEEIFGESTTTPRKYARAEFRLSFLRDVILPYKLVIPKNKEKEIPLNVVHSPFKQKNCTIWMGSAGNVTPFHYDLCHGMLCQVVGTKKVTLYHKDDFRSLYPNANTHPNKTASQLIDFISYDNGDEDLQKRFPKLKEITRYEHELKPGEAMYIPPFFWHHVESITACVSVLIPFDMQGNESLHPCCFY